MPETDILVLCAAASLPTQRGFTLALVNSHGPLCHR